MPLLAPAQTKYKIVVLGSSTAYGVGATIPDSSWVGRTKAFYKGLNLLDTLYNLAVAGSLSDDGVSKISAALSYNPDIVLVGYPSNDIVSALGVPHLTANLRTIYNAVIGFGKKCYVTTTQPRTDPFAEPVLRVGRDSILMEFPGHSLNFYDPLVSPTSDDPNPVYVPEGVHPNDAGHQLLFNVVQASNIIPIVPLPLTLTGFTGRLTDLGVELTWSASNTDGNVDFFIERSTPGTAFQTIYKTKAITDGTVKQYAFTDQNQPATQSFYRIRTVTDGNAVDYSQTLSFAPLATRLAIQKLFITGGRRGITTTIDIPNDGNFYLVVFNSAGIPIKQQSYAGRAPAVTLDIPLPSMPAGIYFLQIATSDGQRTIKPFTVLQ
ncbi:MAG TPA: GDSL-type esterase/lipase family protein [Puia sp.]